jgi:peptide/nickel transport system permease protein
MVIAVCTGIVIGGASGFFEGLTDSFLMRFTDAMLSLPTFFFLLALVALFGGGIAIVVLVIGLTSWMRAARLVRSEFLRWKVREFVLAARAIGAPDMRIIAGHILPQTLPSVLVEATLGVAYAILTESALSFLGLGIRAPTPTWGNMLFNAQGYIWNHAALAIWPGCMILITVLCFNSFGDGLRDAFDPRA